MISEIWYNAVRNRWLYFTLNKMEPISKFDSKILILVQYSLPLRTSLNGPSSGRA
jgi:hypothetical protein